jgi:putative membrane protein
MAAAGAVAAAISVAAARRETGERRDEKMVLVSKADGETIANAIAEAEKTTSGEIVAVIAPSSGSYIYAAFFWPAIVALIVPLPFIHWTWWPIQTIYFLQLFTFAALTVLLLVLRPLRLALVPRSLRRQVAHRRALEQFLAQNLHTTPGRTGVLIFVSVAERFAEIIADAEIHKHVGEASWRIIVDDLTGQIGAGMPVKGFLGAIAAVAKPLAEHFPPGSHPHDSLPNHLIVLPED